ncbi:MAG: hypothetical protein JSW51_03975, partial [Gemmatimonadota bacterium]
MIASCSLPTYTRNRVLAWSGPCLLGLVLATALATPETVLTQQQPSASIMRGAMGLPFIEREAMKQALYELASPEFEGRLTGTDGYALAARYASERFRNAGLVPGGPDGSFVQPFTVEANEVTGPMELRIEHDGWRGAPYRFGRDYVARGFTGSGRIENAEVVFVGYGLVDSEQGWDDYAGVDARGKVALMFMGAP